MIQFWIAMCIGMITSNTPVSDTILTEIQQRSKEENKYILIHFTGSDWCASCKAFQKEVLNQEVIQQEIDSNFVYYKSDYTLKQKMSAADQQRHDFLMEQLNYEGIYPLMVICDPEFKPVKSIQRTKSAEEFSRILKPYFVTQ